VGQITSATKDIADSSPTLRIWPNPVAEGVLQIELPENAAVLDENIAIVNSLGQVVWQGRTKAGERIFSLQTTAWPSGMYGVQLGGLSKWFFIP